MKQYLTKPNVIIFLLITGIVILLITLFKGNRSTDQDLVKQLVAAKDSVIKYQNENIVLHERLIEEKDRTFELLESRDSVLNAHYNEKDFQIKQLNNVIKNIPVRISQLNNNADSIARAFADF